MGHRPWQFKAIVSTKDQNPVVVDAFQRFRKRLFVDRLGWRLSIKDDRECDQFDTSAAIYCVLFRSDELVGGFRAIRTDQEYLAQSVFSNLATLRPFPRRRDVWEISRFGVLANVSRMDAAKMNYGVMLRFAHERQASALVALVDLAHERFLGSVGIRTRRYGPPQTIGTNLMGRTIQGVAGEIPLTEQSGERYRSLIADAQHVEVHDETMAVGRSRVSA